MRKSQVLVIGSSDDSDYLKEAYNIGSYIAEKGYILITGGRGGIMEAASKGASDNNGTVIGILPTDNLTDANKYCNIVIPTGIGFARNIINVLSADIIVAVGGKSGTLNELAYAWQYQKPVICCTFASGWSRLLPDINIDDRIGSNIFKAKTVDEVFKHLDDFFK